MKKLIILLGLILCVCGCSCSMDECEYKCTITYELDGIEHTESYTLHTSPKCYPTYVYTGDELDIITVPYSMFAVKTVYKGTLKVNVVSFDYKNVRQYKVSRWDGHELKRK